MTDDSDNTFTMKERVLQYLKYSLDEIACNEHQIILNSEVNALCEAKTIEEACDIWICDKPSAFLREGDYIEFVVNRKWKWKQKPQPWTKPELHPAVIKLRKKFYLKKFF